MFRWIAHNTIFRNVGSNSPDDTDESSAIQLITSTANYCCFFSCIIQSKCSLIVLRSRDAVCLFSDDKPSLHTLPRRHPQPPSLRRYKLYKPRLRDLRLHDVLTVATVFFILVLQSDLVTAKWRRWRPDWGWKIHSSPYEAIHLEFCTSRSNKNVGDKIRHMYKGGEKCTRLLSTRSLSFYVHRGLISSHNYRLPLRVGSIIVWMWPTHPNVHIRGGTAAENDEQ
jgi:hypothetical protein